jgi:hypothetical protein
MREAHYPSMLSRTSPTRINPHQSAAIALSTSAGTAQLPFSATSSLVSRNGNFIDITWSSGCEIGNVDSVAHLVLKVDSDARFDDAVCVLDREVMVETGEKGGRVGGTR